MSQHGFISSQRCPVRENDGTFGPPLAAWTETLGNVNSNIIMEEDITIAANTEKLADALIEIMNEPQKALVEALPWNTVEILSCAAAMQQSRSTKSREQPFAFQAIISQREGNFVWIRMGDVNDEGAVRPIWAILCTKEPSRAVPSIQFITTTDSASFKHILIKDARSNLTLRPEFAFADGKALLALAKHYMFKGGVVVPYDVTFHRPRYQIDLLNAAKMYESQNKIRNINQRPGNIHDPAIPRSSFTTSYSAARVAEADTTATSVGMPRGSVHKHSASKKNARIIKDFNMRLKTVDKEMAELKAQKDLNERHTKDAEKRHETSSLEIQNLKKRLREEEGILKDIAEELKKQQTDRDFLTRQEVVLKRRRESVPASLPSELRSLFALGVEAGQKIQKPDENNGNDDEDDVPLIQRRRL